MDAAKSENPHPWSTTLWGCVLYPLVFLILSCCLVPPVLNRLAYGRWGASGDPMRLAPGMTPTQVKEVLGPPHDIEINDGRELWRYRDGFLGEPQYSVRFTRDGVVEDWWLH